LTSTVAPGAAKTPPPLLARPVASLPSIVELTIVVALRVETAPPSAATLRGVVSVEGAAVDDQRVGGIPPDRASRLARAPAVLFDIVVL